MFALSRVLLAGSKAAASKAGASVKKAASAKAVTGKTKRSAPASKEAAPMKTATSTKAVTGKTKRSAPASKKAAPMKRTTSTKAVTGKTKRSAPASKTTQTTKKSKAVTKMSAAAVEAEKPSSKAKPATWDSTDMVTTEGGLLIPRVVEPAQMPRTLPADPSVPAPEGYHLRQESEHHGIPPYALFMKARRHAPEHRGLNTSDRARALAKEWHALPAADKQKLKEEAKQVVIHRPARWVRNKDPNAVKKNKYLQFVKDNFHAVRHLPARQRMPILAMNYKRLQQQEESKKQK